MNRNLYPSFLLILISFVSIAFSQDADKPWEKLGLSQIEWQMIIDNKIPDSKVQELLKTGIGIGEYVDKTWIKLNLTEEQWIAKRRSGLTNYDIELQNNTVSNKGALKAEMKSDFSSGGSGLSENRDAAFSLVLPGFEQLKNGKKVRGTIMAALAGGAITWCVTGSIINKRFEAIPLFGILVPDMVWSFIDFKVSERKNAK